VIGCDLLDLPGDSMKRMKAALDPAIAAALSPTLSPLRSGHCSEWSILLGFWTGLERETMASG